MRAPSWVRFKMARLLVLADDFTGALDTGVQFSKEGISAFMSTDTSLTMIGRPEEVLIIDTETRTLPPEDARAIVLDISLRAVAAGISMLYKKTDSTLRGNIGAELVAAAEAFAAPLAFVPAYPQNGRTTIDSIQYLNGLPIDQTGLKDDPINPVTSSFIPDIIAQTSDIPVVCDGSLDRGTISVFDAQSQADLEAVFATLARAGKLSLTAGCAGFAGVLAKADIFSRAPQEITKRRGRMLAVCGSINQTSIEQCEAAKAAGFAVETLSGRRLFEADEAELSAIATELSLRFQNDFLLLLTDGDRSLPPNAPEQIASAIGAIAETLICEDVSHLILFGGNTAAAIMKRAGLSGFSPRTELSPGIVWSETENLSIITKAGGFGGQNVVAEIVEYIQNV